MDPDDAERLEVALTNGPAQLAAGFVNLSLVLALGGSDVRASVSAALDDAEQHIADLRAAL